MSDEPGTMKAMYLIDAQAYVQNLDNLQREGHKVTMVNFANGAWIITYIVGEKPQTH